MIYHIKKLSTATAFTALLGVAACHLDSLTGGELSTDPNNPITATNSQLFVGSQSALWSLWGSEASRAAGLFTQQVAGTARQYASLANTYAITTAETNGIQRGLYVSGGLVDIKRLEQGSLAAKDTTFLGVARVLEGAVMGTGADLFGDLVYKEAISSPTPHLDSQLSVYDSVQTVLSAAVENLSVPTSSNNIGPGPADLVYGGDPTEWLALAHTLKARFYLNTAEVRPEAYAQALAEAAQGVKDESGTYSGAFTASPGEQNFWYQFDIVQRAGDMGPGIFLDNLLKARNDPRRNDYFQHNAADVPTDLSVARLAPDYPQPYVSYDENTLIWAEAAYRTGDLVTALAKLNEERANHALPAEAVAGQALLNEILTEKYIADFQLSEQVWRDYTRTCTPNLVPSPAAASSPSGGKIPGRLIYDISELSTDPNYPDDSSIFWNPDDPANATSDGTGAACLGR
ncbi:MAG: SusD/RagB family nutrient-binding outer membrane lipoprotein [Gemmatimonadaceae bacterium]